MNSRLKKKNEKIKRKRKQKERKQSCLTSKAHKKTFNNYCKETSFKVSHQTTNKKWIDLFHLSLFIRDIWAYLTATCCLSSSFTPVESRKPTFKRTHLHLHWPEPALSSQSATSHHVYRFLSFFLLLMRLFIFSTLPSYLSNWLIFFCFFFFLFFFYLCVGSRVYVALIMERWSFTVTDINASQVERWDRKGLAPWIS